MEDVVADAAPKRPDEGVVDVGVRPPKRPRPDEDVDGCAEESDDVGFGGSEPKGVDGVPVMVKGELSGATVVIFGVLGTKDGVGELGRR